MLFVQSQAELDVSPTAGARSYLRVPQMGPSQGLTGTDLGGADSAVATQYSGGGTSRYGGTLAPAPPPPLPYQHQPYAPLPGAAESPGPVAGYAVVQGWGFGVVRNQIPESSTFAPSPPHVHPSPRDDGSPPGGGLDTGGERHNRDPSLETRTGTEQRSMGH